MEYFKQSVAEFAGLDQVRIAIPDDNMWLNKGSLQLLERAGFPLQVSGDPMFDDDYLALLDRNLEAAQEDPEVLFTVAERSSEEILDGIRESRFGLSIVRPQVRPVRMGVRVLSRFPLPTGEPGALIAPIARPDNSYYGRVACRIIAASQERVQEQANTNGSSAFIGAPTKRYY